MRSDSQELLTRLLCDSDLIQFLFLSDIFPPLLSCWGLEQTEARTCLPLFSALLMTWAGGGVYFTDLLVR